MTKKIFKSTVLASAAVLILGVAFVMGILYQYFGKQLNSELEKEARYLAYGVEQQGQEYLEQIKYGDSRITYIDENGNVLYDNTADEIFYCSCGFRFHQRSGKTAVRSPIQRVQRD